MRLMSSSRSMLSWVVAIDGSEEDFTSLGAGGGLTSKSLSGLDAYDNLFSELDDIENKKSSDNGSGLCSRRFDFRFRRGWVWNGVIRQDE